MRKLALIGFGSAILAAGGYTFGQTVNARYWENVLMVRNTDPGKLEEVAYQWASIFDSLKLRATTTAQIGQVHDEADIALQYAIIKQNEEIIRLLRKVAGETK